jgi:AraC family transcriptional regulator
LDPAKAHGAVKPSATSRRRATVGPPHEVAVPTVEPSLDTATTARDLARDGWRPLFGNYHHSGFSLDWHDFQCDAPMDWTPRIQPGGVELCLNLAGRAVVSDGQQSSELSPQTLAFYRQGVPSLVAARLAGDRHRFITVAFSPGFLAQHFGAKAGQLHPLVRATVGPESTALVSSAVTPAQRLGTALLPVMESLRYPPVFAPAQPVWFQCKALELASLLFFSPPEGELFCTRAQRACCERVERARRIMTEQLREPPTLEELGRLVGCSPYYLSRCFSQEVGLTLQQFLRQVRLERAAELLRSGRCNVTEAALEVGYNSLSHFSTAFREMFGCCPGLYPPRIPGNRGRS